MRILVLCLLLVAPGLLSATTAAKLDLDALTDHAEIVAQGKITSKEARWDKDGKAIWTHYTVDVTDVAKGGEQKTLEFVTRGGVVGKVGQSVSGSGNFRKDDEVVLFLAKDGEKRLQLVGMVQGAFSINDDGGKKTARNSVKGLRLVDKKTLKALAKEDATASEYELADLLKKVRERVKAAAEAEKKATE